MESIFEFKYKIFPSQISEMREMSLVDFDKEFSHIYGDLCISFNKHTFIDSMFLDERGKAFEGLSELISSYLNSFIVTTKNLESSKVIYIKYIENSYTWLKVVNEESDLLIYEVNVQFNPLMNQYFQSGVICNTDLFKHETVKWGAVKIDKIAFKEKVFDTVVKFLKDIEEINPNLLKSKLFNKQINFVKGI